MIAANPLLLLTGSAEALALAVPLADARDAAGCATAIAVMTSDMELPAAVRLPMFEGSVRSVNEMILLMRELRVRGVIDASHSFDRDSGAMAHAACRAMAVPYLRFLRPPWDADLHQRWKSVASVADAMAHIRPGARVFSTTGWPSLPDYADFPGSRLLLRQTARRDREMPFDFVEPVFGVPPFTKASETQLFEEMGVDQLIVRNIGGARSRPKLDAALKLGLDVLLVDRPPVPAGAEVRTDIEAALAWAAAV